jgi:hypothetical protein
MVTIARNIIDTFANPTDAFRNIAESPKWFFVFILIGGISIGIALLLHPYVRHVTFLMLPQDTTDPEMYSILEFIDRISMIGYIINPLIMLLRWVIIGAMIYWLAIIMNAGAFKYNQLYSSIVYAELILVVMSIVNVIILYYRGLESVAHPYDLQAIVGLEVLLWGWENYEFLYIVLKSINVFTIWYIAVLTIAVSVIGKINKYKSAVIVCIVWFVVVVFQAVFASIFTIY